MPLRRNPFYDQIVTTTGADKVDLRTYSRMVYGATDVGVGADKWQVMTATPGAELTFEILYLQIRGFYITQNRYQTTYNFGIGDAQFDNVGYGSAYQIYPNIINDTLAPFGVKTYAVGANDGGYYVRFPEFDLSDDFVIVGRETPNPTLATASGMGPCLYGFMARGGSLLEMISGNFSVQEAMGYIAGGEAFNYGWKICVPS